MNYHLTRTCGGKNVRFIIKSDNVRGKQYDQGILHIGFRDTYAKQGT